MIYFTSDTHFNHQNILKLCNRPFKTIEEHDKALIKNWNHVVKPKDEVYILGDLIMTRSGEKANSLLKQLNGKKYLIVGNHDTYLKDPKFDTSLFVWIKYYYELRYNHKSIILFHYPILEWDDFYGGSIHLYGHVHNTAEDYFKKTLSKRAVNVGVDLTNYTPISIDEVLKLTN